MVSFNGPQEQVRNEKLSPVQGSSLDGDDWPVWREDVHLGKRSNVMAETDLEPYVRGLKDLYFCLIANTLKKYMAGKCFFRTMSAGKLKGVHNRMQNGLKGTLRKHSDQQEASP